MQTRRNIKAVDTAHASHAQYITTVFSMYDVDDTTHGLPQSSARETLISQRKP
jgi:hypothetical protein